MELKKNPDASLNKKSPLFLMIGLTISLSLIITAFEWRFYEEGESMTLVDSSMFDEELLEAINTSQPPPPPPEIVVQEFQEVENEEIIEDIPIEIKTEVVEEEVIEEIIIEEDDEEADKIFSIVEESASPPKGGMSGFYDDLYRIVRYPAASRKMKIQGKVLIQFVVEVDGSFTDVKLLRGVSDELDAEAIRAIKAYKKKWNPGKQRGKAVRQRYMIPVQFQLN